MARNPAWSHDGIVCTGESFKEVVKLTFARGATIKDPKKLFSSSLEGTPGVRLTAVKGNHRPTRLQAAHPRRRGGQFRGACSTGSQEEVNLAPTVVTVIRNSQFCNFKNYFVAPLAKGDNFRYHRFSPRRLRETTATRRKATLYWIQWRKL